MGHDASIKEVARQSAMGFLNNDDNMAKVHVRYYDPGSFTEVPGNNPGNLVEVSVESYTWGWLALLMRNVGPLQITTRSADRMEGLPAGSSPPAR